MPSAPTINQSRSSSAQPACRQHLTVCQVVHGLPIGGAEVLVSRIVRRLDDRFRFVVACLDEIGELGESLANEGVKIVQLGRRPGFDWRCVRELRRFLADERIDVVHAHQYTPFAYAVATRVFGRRPPVLFTEHGRFYPDYPSFKRQVFNRLLPDRRDRFIAVGESVRQALIRNEGLPQRRVEIVYNGVEISAFDNGDRCRDEVRRELGVADGNFLVVQVARLDTIKDHATAVRAISAALRRNPAVQLMIVGDGPERDVIVQAIKALGLERNVTMLGLRHDVRRILSAADAFLLTSLSEGIPVTIIEAMAARVPVVATAVGGVPELIEHGETGLLSPVGDSMGLADALVRLAADGELRERLSRAARKRVETRFSERQMIDAYAAIYESMHVAKDAASSLELSTRR